MGEYNEKLYRDIPLFSTDLNIPWTPLIFSKKLHICSVEEPYGSHTRYDPDTCLSCSCSICVYSKAGGNGIL